MKKKREVTIRLGRLGLSLLAAGITAVGVAAVSMAADNGSDTQSNDSGSQTFQAPAPGGGVGVMSFRGPNLSDADRQKMEDFRKCMEDNGAPGPPDPSEIDPSDGPPKPPSKADQEKLQKAFEACKDKLPEELQDAPGPPPPPGVGCRNGAPNGAPGRPPGQQQGQGQNQNQGQSAPGYTAPGASPS